MKFILITRIMRDIMNFFIQVQSIEIFVNLIEVFASTILTIGLVYLYYKMHETQERQAKLSESQTEIMADQESLMRMEYRPDLSVGAVNFTSGTFSHEISAKITNDGRGNATNFHIRVDMEPYSGLDFYRPVEPVTSLNEAEIYPTLSKMHRYEKNNEEGKISKVDIAPTEVKILEGIIEFSPMYGSLLQKEVYTVENIAEIARNEEIESIRLQFTLIYQDESEKIHADPIFQANLVISDSDFELEPVTMPEVFISGEAIINDIENRRISAFELDHWQLN
jgi:hypothetical protein